MSMENLPVVGKPLQKVSDAVEPLRPKDDDSTPVVVAKRTAQIGIIGTAAAIVAVATRWMRSAGTDSPASAALRASALA